MWFNRDFEFGITSTLYCNKKMFAMMTEEKKEYTVYKRVKAASPTRNTISIHIIYILPFSTAHIRLAIRDT